MGFASWTAAEAPPVCWPLGGPAGLCFIKKSRRAPSVKEAMAGSLPRKRSSSLWKEMLSDPEA